MASCGRLRGELKRSSLQFSIILPDYDTVFLVGVNRIGLLLFTTTKAYPVQLCVNIGI